MKHLLFKVSCKYDAFKCAFKAQFITKTQWPSFLWNINYELTTKTIQITRMKKLPSEFFTSKCWIGIDLVEMILLERLVISWLLISVNNSLHRFTFRQLIQNKVHWVLIKVPTSHISEIKWPKDCTFSWWNCICTLNMYFKLVQIALMYSKALV